MARGPDLFALTIKAGMVTSVAPDQFRWMASAAPRTTDPGRLVGAAAAPAVGLAYTRPLRPRETTCTRRPGMILLSLAAAPAFAEEKTIDPGLYEVVTTSVMQGASMGEPTTARMCLTAKDVANGLSPALEKNCTRVRNVTAGGKLDYAMTCPDSTTTMTGSYTPTGYLIDGKITMKDGSETMVIQTHIVAKRVKEKC